MIEKYYTVDQVAEMLDMHPKTIRKYIREGKLRASKVGKQWRITGHDLSLFTEGNSNLQVFNKVEDIEYKTTESVRNSREKVTVSAVVDIRVVDMEEAMRIANILTAVLNSKDPEYGQSMMKVQFLEKDLKVRVMLWGTIKLIEVMLESISTLIE